MNLNELSKEEADILYSACIVFAEELGSMRSKTAAMDDLANQLAKKQAVCYKLAEKIAVLKEEQSNC